jgi:hypothetical protein
MDSASAETDAGVNRKAHRRAYRRDRYDYSRYERFSYQGFWRNYGYAYQPWWSR